MTPWLEDPDVTLYHGDCLEVLRQLPDRSVHMCATSPPFYGLRDYGTGAWDGGDPDCDHKRHKADAPKDSTSTLHSRATNQNHEREPWPNGTCGKCGARRVDQQIGLEETPERWVERLVAVFREVRRVLRDDGTLWIEIGDSYAQAQIRDRRDTGPSEWGDRGGERYERGTTGDGLKQKDLLGQPWLLAFALRADGWWLRSEIIWARPNPMPESVTDRPTKSHSTVFLLSKSPRYYFDADAIREPNYGDGRKRGGRNPRPGIDINGGHQANEGGIQNDNAGRNARSVWSIPTQPTPFAHFATWPQKLVARMVLAGTSERGCCPECGAPWVRDVEREGGTWQSRVDDGHPSRYGYSQAATVHIGSSTSKTLGWSPSCDHHGYPEIEEPGTVPCTVLDPFAGSGTTMLVARNHGRHSIGIELNHAYLEIAAKRLQQLSLLA